MIVLPLLPTVRQVPGATSSGSVAKLPGSVPVVLGGFVTGIPLDGCGVVPDSLACLQSDRRSARLAQWWSAHSRGKTREGCQEIKIGEVGYQAQGELTAVTMIRRYNRFWTQEDDQLLLELRAAGRSSIIIAAALHRSPQAIEKRLFTFRARLQFAEVVAIPSEKKAEA